jgi:DNA invertase Pin-like site-specific DNA recombinase
MKKVGYGRVSSMGQELDSQLAALKEEGCEVIYSEKFTGAKMNRPEFMKVLGVLKKGDTLVVTKLDRLARNTEEGIKVIRELFEKGVKVHVMNIGMLEDTTIGRFFLQTLLAVAELERNMIADRMAEGKAVARLKPDYREGRKKKFTKKQIEHAVDQLKDHSYTQVEALTGISKSTLVREARKRRAKEATFG